MMLLLSRVREVCGSSVAPESAAEVVAVAVSEAVDDKDSIPTESVAVAAAESVPVTIAESVAVAAAESVTIVSVPVTVVYIAKQLVSRL